MKKKKITDRINLHVQLFNKWLKDNYSDKQIEEQVYDDTGYPKWPEIENTFEIAFKELDFSTLTIQELENISFLLARQWDVGVIFPYFREEISQIGMTEEQLLILSEFALSSKEWSFRQQCVAAIYKAKNNRKKATEIALQFYKQEDSDLRGHALSSLHKLNYEDIRQLLSNSWKYNDELERVYCLHIWREIDKNKFEYYLEEAKKDNREIIKENVAYLLRTKKDNNIE